ncbi:MAG: hypothetical protein KJ051_09710 [Thermoleophilia bacterium]|nr:hypothetical protein [Thermoleophilia bacterium]
MRDIERRLVAAGIRVPAGQLCDPGMRECLEFFVGDEPSLDQLVSCYGGGREMAAAGSKYDRASGAGAGIFVPSPAGKEEDLGLLAQRLGLAVANGVMSQEEARQLLRKRGVELEATPPPLPEKKPAGGQELGESCPVEAALRDGRLDASDRDAFRSYFAESPAFTAAALADLRPDPGRAARNFWADDRNRAAYEAVRCAFGITDQEV